MLKHLYSANREVISLILTISALHTNSFGGFELVTSCLVSKRSSDLTKAYKSASICKWFYYINNSGKMKIVLIIPPVKCATVLCHAPLGFQVISL